MRPIPQIAVDFVSREESFSAKPYRDSGGRWTNGFGNTNGVTASTPPVARPQALARLDQNMEVAQLRLTHCLRQPEIDALKDYQYAALLSFAYNAGADPSWQIWASVPHGDMAVAAQLLRVIHAGAPPEVVDGLKNRRTAEIALYEGRDPLCKAEGNTA